AHQGWHTHRHARETQVATNHLIFSDAGFTPNSHAPLADVLHLPKNRDIGIRDRQGREWKGVCVFAGESRVPSLILVAICHLGGSISTATKRFIAENLGSTRPGGVDLWQLGDCEGSKVKGTGAPRVSDIIPHLRAISKQSANRLGLQREEREESEECEEEDSNR